MSLLKKLTGNRKQNEPRSSLPKCSSCGFPVPLRILGITEGIGKTLPFEGKLPPGAELFEGTQCTACGHMYCLDCHDFATKGPKCPNCGQWGLVPIIR